MKIPVSFSYLCITVQDGGKPGTSVKVWKCPVISDKIK